MSRSSDIAVRERLLTSALKLFTRKGYAATTVREIVTAAGVTKPALYYYFGKKEGIYFELMNEISAKFVALFDASRHEQRSVTERLLHLCDQAFSLLIDNLDMARLMYAIYYGPPQGAPFFDCESSRLKFRQEIRCLINDGIRRGEFQRGRIDDMVWATKEAESILKDFVKNFQERDIHDVWAEIRGQTEAPEPTRPRLSAQADCIEFGVLAGIAQGQPAAHIDSVVDEAKFRQKEIARLRCDGRR